MTKTLSTKKQIFKIEDLHPAEYNPRTIKKEALNGLEKSLDKFGYLQHIVVNTRDGKNTIISGHQRIKALALSGNEKIECIVVDFDGITEKAANVALNAESISGDWVLEDLEEILFELQVELPDDEFDDLNYDDLASELDIELDSLEDDGTDEKADEVPEAPEKTSIKLGDLVRLGDHTVLCGDSTKAEDVQKLMEEGKIDLVFSDPPYGIDIVANSPRLQETKKLGSIGGSVMAKVGKYKPIENDNTTDVAKDSLSLFPDIPKIIWGGNYFTDFLPPSRGWIIWDNRNGDTTFADCEIAYTTFDKSIRLYSYLWSGMRREGSRKEEGKLRSHPTQKPVGLIVNIFKDWAIDYKTIFDGFLGSGSTLIACEKTKRRCYGIEIDPHYVSVIISRWCQYTGNRQVMINDKVVEWEEYSTV